MKSNAAALSYSLIKSYRKSISIIVHPDGSVVVRAPKRATDSQIREVLDKRIDWIIKHKKKFEVERHLYPKREFVSDEKHLFLGEEYTLRVNNCSANSTVVNSVSCNGEFIDVWCDDDSKPEALMQQWYLYMAKVKFPQIVNPVIQKFNKVYNVSPNKIAVKHMKSRWGSCSSKGSVSLNSKLIQAPVRCIEYVMVHELCHLIHFNHSRDFYSLLSEVVPDWKERKKELRSILPYGC
ncbi:MAG: SprT family zinc-dependent metalloprotease [Fermentimonas sp.]|nr:SprT family zinc-dependent metalloprotease [Fermentimonas sp.]